MPNNTLERTGGHRGRLVHGETVSPRVVGWTIAAIAFCGSLLVPILTYVPWMLAVYITGDTGKPRTETLVIGALLLGCQSGLVGYFAAKLYAWIPDDDAKDGKGAA